MNWRFPVAMGKSLTAVQKKDIERGFTLLEVIVAISILTVGLLAVASMQASAIRGNTLAGGVTEATNWASDQIEKLVELPYNDGRLQDKDGDGSAGLNDTEFDDDPGTQPDADYGEIRQAPQGRQYKVYWNVAENDLKSGTKTINVIVTWQDHGIQKVVSMQNVRSNT
jgi:type IV pilus assembly protein PilV